MLKNIEINVLKSYLKGLEKKVFTTQDLNDVFSAKEESWNIPLEWKAKDFVDFVLDNNIFSQQALTKNKNTRRYFFNTPSAYEVAIEAFQNSYFSHYTAMQFHGLTEQLPKNIYVTHEQITTSITKLDSSSISQTNIDKAFSKKQRVIKNESMVYDNCTIYWQQKKVPQSIGIIQRPVFSDKIVKITNVERTLIDCVIRPLFAGGIYEILKSFENAKPIISVNKLCSYLKKLNHIYPYHQCIGFYMEKTGVYSDMQLNLLQEFEQIHDFYLTYDIKDLDYSKRWKLHYPRGF